MNTSQDVLLAMGLIQSESPSLIIDAAGIVRRTGLSATTLKVGDRVMLASTVAFATRITVSELRCITIPDGLTFAEASTMPVAYTTVIYSLINVGRLQEGQVSITVLVTSPNPNYFGPELR